MSDLSGQIIWKAQYKAWGECKAEKVKSNFFENSEIISNNIRFQGQYFDEETGFHYNRHRYYSPYVGRFISKDPIGLLGGHNVYAYAPNPIDWVDPRGLARVKGSKGSSGKGEGFHLRRNLVQAILVKDEILQHLRDHGKVKTLTQVKIVIKM